MFMFCIVLCFNCYFLIVEVMVFCLRCFWNFFCLFLGSVERFIFCNFMRGLRFFFNVERFLFFCVVGVSFGILFVMGIRDCLCILDVWVVLRLKRFFLKFLEVVRLYCG